MGGGIYCLCFKEKKTTCNKLIYLPSISKILWLSMHRKVQFSKFNGEDGSFFQGDFLETIMKTIEKISKNPKVIEGYLDKAVKSYLDDLSYQITFKKLSQMETKTGD